MRILGIDLGKTGVKAVELDTAFGRYEIHEYHERPLALGTGLGADPVAAVHDLIHNLPKAPDRIVVAIRSGQTTFRNLQLPTRDKKAIQASVGFELEDELPFPIEDAVFDHTIISQQGQLSQVHVASTMGKYIQPLLEQWRGMGVDPDIVTSEAWAYRALLNRMTGPLEPDAGAEAVAAAERPTLVLQLGHDRSLIYVHWKGVPIVSREIKWGGADLTLAICQKYGIPIEQAEAAKLDHGFVLPESQRHQATAEQLEFSNALMLPLSVLLREIRQAELTCKGITSLPLGRLLLSGGTSLLPGLGKRLSEELRLAVHPLHALSSISHSGVTYTEETDAKFSLAAALAMTQVGPGRTAGINLRRGEFAKRGSSGEFGLEQLKGPLTAVGAIAACVMVSFVVQSSVYQRRLTETNSQLERSIKTFFGGLPPNVVRNYMNSTSTLRKQVNGELTKQRELTKLSSPNPHSPLDFLKELSEATPKDVIVDVAQFQVGAAATDPYSATEPQTASLTVLVNNAQMAEKFANIVGGKISKLDRSKMEEVAVPGAPEGAPKKWKVTFSGKPNEESFGK